MTRILTLLAALFVLIGAAWGYATLQPCAAPTQRVRALGLPVGAASCPGAIASAAAAEAPIAPPPPPAVTVATAERREFVERLFVSGTLTPREEAQVAARIDGLTIVELDAEDGDWVKAGQVMARLDRNQLDALIAENDAAIKRADAAIAQARNMVTQAEAQAQWASSDYQRAQKLGAGVMSASTVEQRQTAEKTAEAQLAGASSALGVAEADRKARDAERRELEVRITRTDVTAPVAGLVSRRSAKLGATASGAGEPLFRIIVDGGVDLDADAPEQSLTRFANGMPAIIRLPGVSDPVPGHVRLISQEVDKASRTGKVRIALSDVSHAHIGAFASAEVELVRRDGVGAPASAVRREGDAARLYVVRDGRIEERTVTPGIVDGDAIEIKDGLAEGETVVAKAAAFLRPGDWVRPVPMATTAAGG
jgi:RND family efflux transporter MFP subunit